MSIKKKHASMKIHAGDRVVVLSGKDKGAEGVVERAIRRKKERSSSRASTWRTSTRPRPAATSKVESSKKPCRSTYPTSRWVSPGDGKATRVGYLITEEGQKVRVCRRTGVEI